MAVDVEFYRAALAAANADAARLWGVYRQAHRNFFDADRRALHARFDLESEERRAAQEAEEDAEYERRKSERRARKNDY